jgi:YbgC/YbaW family acyl-CoA thioester hydrolase
MAFSIELQVRDYELDQYGVVNNSVYLGYLEHARHEFLRGLGIDGAEVARAGRALTLSEIHVRFRDSLRSRDRFTVSVTIAEVGGARVTFGQAIHKEGDPKPALEATAVAVFLDERGRPQRVAGELRERFLRQMRPGADG